MKFFITAFLFFTLSLGFSQQADRDTQLYRCYIADGNVLSGYIVKESKDIITLDVPNIGLVTFSKSDLQSIVASNGFKSYSPDRVLLYNDNYFFSDNAFTPKAKSLYYQSQDIFFNRFTLSFSDHIAMEMGSIIEPIDGQIAGVLGLKCGYSISKNFHLGLKAQFIGTSDEDRYNINSGILTIGDIKNNVSFGLHQVTYREGYIRNPENLNKYLYSLCGMVSITQKSGFKFEHIYFSDRASMLNFGFSYNVRSLSFTYGLVIYSEDKNDIYYDSNTPIPLLGLKIPLKG